MVAVHSVQPLCLCVCVCSVIQFISPSVLLIHCSCLLQEPSQDGRWGGHHEPGGLEGEVHGPGGSAHEVQDADHQDTGADGRQS